MIYSNIFSGLALDLKKASIQSLHLNGREMLAGNITLFSVRFMDRRGNFTVYSAEDATLVSVTADGREAVYSGFPEDFSVTVRLGESEEACAIEISVTNHTDQAVEWVEYPRLILPNLKDNGGIGQVLFPYNEGVLISDIKLRNSSNFGFHEAEYPSRGVNPVFPNMCFTQFMCYLADGFGIYLGAHDVDRTVKHFDLIETACGVRLILQVFAGTGFGEDYVAGFPVVLQTFRGSWQDGADIYRQWFLDHLPVDLKKADETELPDWYGTLPLVVTYPVRGIHDMDEMNPNALFPYINALPFLDRIADETRAKLMVILMHWEGTAPWAPPYVWPPFGGEDCLNEFADALHKRGHALGAYCSGFGYTVKSNLTDYDNSERLRVEHAEDGFCISPDGATYTSTICQGQRESFDLCVGSDKGRDILNRAYAPLFESKLDYIQILDQNHGGGQYFCYSRNHGHPPVPGKWMTETMTDFLSGWKKKAGLRLFGCESSSSEPFLSYLRFSDNRYELNYLIGEPVPLFAYLYHEFVHNFMGNQVCCGLNYKEDTLCYRMAYSFLAGDAMTLVMTPFGTLMPNWGCHDFNYSPDLSDALAFAGGMQKILNSDAGEYLMKGRMIKEEDYACDRILFHTEDGRDYIVKSVLSSAWSYGGKKVQIFANHTGERREVKFSGETFVIPPLSGAVRAMK